jgi:type IV secretory pathway VirD2 relaxase
MAFKLNPEYKEELMWRIRRSIIPRDAPHDNSFELRGCLNRIKYINVYYGNYRRNGSHVIYQNSVVKVSYLKNEYDNQWKAHGRYLQREGAQVEGKVGLGFDREKEEVDIYEKVGRWQEKGDVRMFKIIVSPELGERMDLREHTRLVMEKIEMDYGTRLEWAAIDHYNSINPHVHIVLRGQDQNGKEIRFKKEYIRNGIRTRSKEVATRQLGMRLIKDVLKRREMAVRKNYITELDRDIERLKDKDNKITFRNRLPKSRYELQKRLHIIGRLQYLETLGFAEKKGIITWQVSDDMLNGLKAIQTAGDIIKRKANHISAITEPTLPVARTFLSPGQSLAGRVVGSGLHDENYDKRYMLIEGLDGKVHYIHPSKSMVVHRDAWDIRNDDIIHLEVKTFFKNGKDISYLKFTNWGTLDQLKWSKSITAADRYFIVHFLKNKGTLDINRDIRTFRRKFYNMMKERIVRFQTLGYIDKNLRIKRYSVKRE